MRENTRKKGSEYISYVSMMLTGVAKEKEMHMKVSLSVILLLQEQMLHKKFNRYSGTSLE